MKETLLVKHAVGGRTFIDTGKQPLDYEVIPEGEGWRFVIRTPWNDKVEEIVKWRNELNVFLFEEYSDRPTVKNWYYIKDGPVEYDQENERLTIHAQSRIGYVPDEFTVL
ncbi:hypothetical protein [Paenibacillus puerhi]|uniref:hypothetical protein n=1 Tax=Paenibacillus puerhi TaxID=2692622 RepID=UPI00135AA52B|nr:hypothetical protein [Paenibacillus puerhi]